MPKCQNIYIEKSFNFQENNNNKYIDDSGFVKTCDEQCKKVISWLMVKGSNMTTTNYGKKSMGMNRKSYANTF
jgi:hypothetical protein